MSANFDIYLYYMTDEKNKVNKTLGTGAKFTGTLRADADITNPSIAFNVSADAICGYNYAYIPVFKRYYFIKNVNTYRDGISIVSMTVDVLKSFASTIMNSTCIISRSSNPTDWNKNFALPDDRFPIKQSQTTHVISYPELYSNTDPLKAQSLILVLTGISPSS